MHFPHRTPQRSQGPFRHSRRCVFFSSTTWLTTHDHRSCMCMHLQAANKRSDGLDHRRPYTRDASTPKRRCSKSLRQALCICPVKRRQVETDGSHPHTSNTFVPKDEETATPWLPGVLHDGLAARLGRELFGKAGVRTGAEEDLDQYESAFEFAPAPDRCV